VKTAAAARQRRLKLQTSYGQAMIHARGYSAPETAVAFAHARELAPGIADFAERSFGHAPATTPLLWMRMPGGASTGLKCHIAATDKCRIGRLKQRVKAHCAGEIVRRSPTRWLGADTFDFHCSIPLCPPASAAYSFERRRQAAASTQNR
jgi:hypothetical protein